MNAPDLDSYDTIIIYLSGGKDSLACLLHLLESGVDRTRLELWHHEIDGREGSGLMDWPVTPDYCRQVAKHFGIPIYFSWKVGGFEGEMLRENSLTRPTRFETPEGMIQIGGKTGKPNTRLQFPQVSANLSVRWCSAYLKIDVAAIAIRGQERFKGKRVLTVSGERAQESAARAKYSDFEPDRTDLRNGRKVRRHVDRWRPVHSWSEERIWEIIERWRINPHPAYHLGWGRVSCMFCIFGSDNQWATCQQIAPERTGELVLFEDLFEKTIHRTRSIPDRVERGTSYETATAERAQAALSEAYTEPIELDQWELPAGAFGESCGPT